MLGERNGPTVADVFRAGFDDYLRGKGKLPARHYTVANAIMDCRTEKLGGHMYRCEHCGNQVPVFNSCRNRHCPQCQATARAQWTDKRMEELLPVSYFHVVFTVPGELRPIALRNKKVFYNLMFRVVAQTLTELGTNPQHLGGAIGFLAILHTWTQTLMDHPHIHCLVPAGALAPDGVEWIPCRKDFLFPVAVVKALYRGKFMAGFKQAVEAGDIQLGERHAAKGGCYRKLLDTLYETEWVVYMKHTLQSAQAVVKYLASYTNRIAISDARIKALDNEKVTFSYRDRRHEDVEKPLTLPLTTFIGRFLLHVLPKGFVRIRHYGFMANKDRTEKIAQCRMAVLGGEEINPLEDLGHEAQTAGHTEPKKAHKCPYCGRLALVLAEEIPKRGRVPMLKAA
jgi:hypothetical protein